jgi:probable F420-dependent oxidoreductase
MTIAAPFDPWRNQPRLGVLLPPDEGLSAAELLRLAVLAEEVGYSTVATGEVAGPEAFALLGMVAAVTKRVTIGTGVIPMATRSVPLIAMGFSTLESMAPGRIFAGVGASSPTVVEQWHGRDYPKALTHVREFIPALRIALQGDRLEFHGEFVRSNGFRLKLPSSRIPIVVAAMNPKMLEIAGALADGVFLAWCSVEDSAEKVALVRRSAERTGRDPSSVVIFQSLHAYTGTETTAVIERLRREMLGYATVPTHRPSFERVVASLDEINELWASGERREALAKIDDKSVLAFTAIGSPDTVASRIREYWEAGVDCPVLFPVGSKPGSVGELLATVETTARSLKPRIDDVGPTH